MVDVGSKRCDHPDGCSKRTHFGQPGSPATRCATHKEPGMVSINGTATIPAAAARSQVSATLVDHALGAPHTSNLTWCV